MKRLNFVLFIITSYNAFSQINSPNGDNIFTYNGLADVIFRFPERGVGGRAFVHYPNNILSINYASDFTGGTLIGNDVFFKDGGNSYIMSGNLGIGTFQPQAKLHVQGDLQNDGNILLGHVGETNYLTSREVDQQLGIRGSKSIIFGTYNDGWKDRMVVSNIGDVGIGVSNPANKLDVNGTIHSKEVKVDMIGWSDFVFKKEYNLPTLEQVEKHIKENGHLENIPSEKEVLENGINLGEMNAKLLQKIEELTLYMITKEKTINKQQEIIEAQSVRLSIIEKYFAEWKKCNQN